MIRYQYRHIMNWFPSLLFLSITLLWAPLNQAFVPQQSTASYSSRYHTSSCPGRSRILSLEVVAKSGGKMLETEEMYMETVLSKELSRPVLVYFSAPWCGPCRLTNPVVKEVMKQYAGEIDAVEVCTDDLAEIAENAGIVSIPTIQFYYGGELMDTIVGCVAKSVLTNAIQKLLDDIQQIKSKKQP